MVVGLSNHKRIWSGYVILFDDLNTRPLLGTFQVFTSWQFKLFNKAAGGGSVLA
jgi:hypothetical protein